MTHIGSDAFKETLYWHGLLDEFVILGDGILIDYNGKDKDVVVPEGVKTVVDAFRSKSVERVTRRQPARNRRKRVCLRAGAAKRPFRSVLRADYRLPTARSAPARRCGKSSYPTA